MTSLPGWAKARWLAIAAGGGAVVGLLATRVSTPLLVLAAVIGLPIAAAVIAVPEVGLLALTFGTWANLSEVLAHNFGAGLTVMKLLIPAVALAVIARWFLRGHRPEGWLRPALLVAAYGLAGVLSLPAAVDLDRSLVGLADLAKDGAVLVLVVILIQRGATLRRVLWALLAAGLLMGTISVHQYFTGSFDSSYWGLASETMAWASSEGREYRIRGPIGNPNSYGLILLVLIPIAVNRVTCRSGLTMRLFALWALIVCSLSIVFTFSRGAFVGLAAQLAFLLILRRPRLRHVLVALVIAVLLSPLVPKSYFERLSTLASAVTLPHETTGFSSMRGRFSENLAAVYMFLDHPLAGVGLNNYPVRYQDYSQQIMLDPRSTERAPHNLYLEVASETGVVGLLAFGAILWVVSAGFLAARKSLRVPGLAELRGMTDAVAIGLFGYLVSSLFLHAAHARYFWLLMGIALALPRVASAERAALREVSSSDVRPR